MARSLALVEVAEAMAKAGQTERANQAFQLALQAAQKIEDALDRSLALGKSPKRWRKRGNLTLPSKSPRKLKPHWIVLGRLLKSLPRWQKRGKRNGLIKPFQLALQVAQKIEGASDRSSALTGIADDAKAGQRNGLIKPFTSTRHSLLAIRCRFRLGRSLALPIHSVPRPTTLVPLKVGAQFSASSTTD
jgi:hypothetical protein